MRGAVSEDMKNTGPSLPSLSEVVVIYMYECHIAFEFGVLKMVVQLLVMV